MSDCELGEIMAFACQVASEAEVTILRHFRNCVPTYKADGTPVTVADKEAENIIRERLGRQFPQATILGEEFGGDARPAAGDQWIIDPIDGTSPYALGVPTFGTLIALLRDGEPVIGVINLPAMGEMVFAAKGHGCSLKMKGEALQAIKVDHCGDLSRAYASTSGIYCSELDEPSRQRFHLRSLVAACARFRVVGDCVQHALVCRGRPHLAIDPIMAPWDSAALIPCIREAGGAVADLHGKTENLTFAGSLVTACDEKILTGAIEAMHTRA